MRSMHLASRCVDLCPRCHRKLRLVEIAQVELWTAISVLRGLGLSDVLRVCWLARK
ncbi:hypothetical protein C8R44DRAFT_790587 [Mycena epipterygia]|nr:hypothetical protein C8R44DRAFT_790587 [Mycena epipterygia]